MSENFEREKELFNEALNLRSLEARRAFLKDACGPADDLREKIEALLKVFESAEGFIPTQGDSVRGPDLPGVVLEQAGDRIGRYKLLQKVGEGGCGVVYMAEQEEPVRRRVVLKVIKLGMDTESVIARLEAERQALALMDHPNIGKVLDWGDRTQLLQEFDFCLEIPPVIGTPGQTSSHSTFGLTWLPFTSHRPHL